MVAFENFIVYLIGPCLSVSFYSQIVKSNGHKFERFRLLSEKWGDWFFHHTVLRITSSGDSFTELILQRPITRALLVPLINLKLQNLKQETVCRAMLRGRDATSARQEHLDCRRSRRRVACRVFASTAQRSAERRWPPGRKCAPPDHALWASTMTTRPAQRTPSLSTRRKSATSMWVLSLHVLYV